jgi:hypothetical protein
MPQKIDRSTLIMCLAVIGLGGLAYWLIPAVRAQGGWLILFLLCSLMHIFMHGQHKK